MRLFDTFNTSYLTDSYIVFTKNWNLDPKLHFWPKNDGEKWSRKIYFEIPPCGKTVIFVTEFEILCKTPKKNELEENSFGMEEFLKYVF